MLRILLLTKAAGLAAACAVDGGDTIPMPTSPGNAAAPVLPATYEERVALYSAKDCDTDEFNDLLPRDEPVDGAVVADVHLVRVGSAQWSDASLGVRQPGKAYAQVVTPGCVIVLELSHLFYTYHTDTAAHALLAFTALY